MKSKKNHILHFAFYIVITPLLLLILSCSSTTEITKGELSGIVNLEGMQDYSGINVNYQFLMFNFKL